MDDERPSEHSAAMTYSAEEIESAAQKLKRKWLDDPCSFAVDVFDIEPWDDGSGTSQADSMRACAKSTLTARRSGHKVGKSMEEALMAFWAYTLFEDARIVVTAPVFRQVREVAWREITKLHRRARFPLGGKLGKTPIGGLNHPNGNQIFGLTADDPDAFSGVSAANVFYLADEASGIDEAIFEAIHGNRAGGARLWMWGNPTQVSGQFHRAFHDESDLYTTSHMSSEQVAEWQHRTGKRIPGLAIWSWIKERRRAWMPHETHPAYLVRVLGHFPPAGARKIVALAGWEKARARFDTMFGPNPNWMDLNTDLAREHRRLVCALDVARFGDDQSTLSMRRGDVLYPVRVTQGLDTNELAGWAQANIREMIHSLDRDAYGHGSAALTVDCTGLGAGAFDVIAGTSAADRGYELRCFEHYGSARSDDPETYANLRAQIWFNADTWLKEYGMVPADPDLRAELLTPEYKFDKGGHILAEEKQAVKKRLGRSPDRADAVTMCTYGRAHSAANRSGGAVRPLNVRGL